MIRYLLFAVILIYVVLAACSNPWVCYDSPSGTKDYAHLRPQGAFVSDLNQKENFWRIIFMGDSAVLTVDQGETNVRVVYDVEVVGTHIEEVE